MNTIFTTLVLMHALAAETKAVAPKEALYRLNSFAQIEGQFMQTKTLQELDVQIKTEGSFSIKKSVTNKSLFHWSIKKPTVSLVCIDSEGIEISSNSTEKDASVKKKKIKFAEMGAETNNQVLNFFKLLSLNKESAAELFTVEKLGNEFLLRPKNKEESLFQTVQIKINDRGLVEKLIVEEKSHDKIELHFFNLKTLQVLPAAELELLQCEK